VSEAWRVFVALPIGEELRSSLRAAVAAWQMRSDLAGLRWTDPDHWHLTVAFIGPTDAAAVPRMADALRAIAGHQARRRVPTGGLGAFPAPARARVAWYGVSDSDGVLEALVREVAPAVGLDDPGRYRPHITLARAGGAPVDLRPWLAEATAPTMSLDLDRLDLMRSHIGRGPAHYELLASAPFGGSTDD
jgi:2'-5' RNA ligase